MPKVVKSQFAMDFGKFQTHQRQQFKGKRFIPENFRPTDEPLFRHIFWRLRLMMNTILLIVGGVRTGKSYTGLKIAEGYMNRIGKRDKDGKRIRFDVNEQCSFDVLPFLKWSQTEKDSVFVLDEVGVTLSAQEWFTMQNRVFSSFCQAQGFRRNLMILILPNISFLNKRVRFLCNYIIEMNSQGRGVMRKLVMNHTFGKGYPTYMGGVKVSKPTKKTIEAYENMKQIWNDNLLRENIEMLTADKEKKRFRHQGFGAAADPRLRAGRMDSLPT